MRHHILKYTTIVPIAGAIVFSWFTWGNTTAYNASYANKHGARYGIFYTKMVGEIIERKRQAGNILPADESYNEQNFNFVCPGDSFIIGIQSVYKYFEIPDDRQNYADRSFSFICGFLEDEQDRLIRKEKCDVKDVAPDNSEKKAGSSSCEKEEEFIFGMASKKFYGEKWDDKSGIKLKDDRLYKSYCCSMKDQDGNLLKSTGSCKTRTFKQGSTFAGPTKFLCPDGQVLKKMETAYHSSVFDRDFKFTCCTAGVK